MPFDCFALSGRIDRAAVPLLQAELWAFVLRTTGDVTLNCADLVSIDGEGVRALIGFRDLLGRDGRRLRFVELSESLAHELIQADRPDAVSARVR